MNWPQIAFVLNPRGVIADPRLVSAARELRDRWLEQVNLEPLALPCGKCEVTRAIGESVKIEVEPMKLLAAA